MYPLTRLFVGNLPENTNEKDLIHAFSSYGEIMNLDLKTKLATETSKKNFAFITLSADNRNVESCIKHFSIHEFKGNKLYVTRARESFLERLQREREQAQTVKDIKKQGDQELPKKQPVLKLGEKLNPRKRKVQNGGDHISNDHNFKNKLKPEHPPGDGASKAKVETEHKKQDSDSKRIESLRRKRQEFKAKQMIIKTGLMGIDKVQNKKVVFSDEDDSLRLKPKLYRTPNDVKQSKSTSKGSDKRNIFDDDGDSGEEVNFDIKKQFEGKKGQKVLDLQSRYKSDKRFILDARFIEESEDEKVEDEGINDNETVEVGAENEKAKQLDILQEVLGVALKSRPTEPLNKKAKPKLGMLRFDPTQAGHAKFLAPVQEIQESKKDKKRKKEKQEEVKPEVPEGPAVEVSKEQFYKVSETLKETIAQPTTFSLRSLFASTEEECDKNERQETDYIPLEILKEKKKKVKNPLDIGEKNPFVYDSSDSETEEKDEIKLKSIKEPVEEVKKELKEPKAVWKENLFFSKSDVRFREGLAFFNKVSENEAHKERRELKSLMKKRIYNKERKSQMFLKKIGGRKKTMKKKAQKL